MFPRLAFAGALAALCFAASAADAVRFGRDILPILSDNCFSCHGPDEKQRKGGLRLDTRDGALAVHKGTAAVVPGDPGQSELLRRVLSSDPDSIMPPSKAHRTLTPAQLGLLRHWIEEGAVWGRHWAFEPPVRPSVPLMRISDTGRSDEALNPIDALVRDRLRREGIPWAAPASRAALLRRVSFDLTGLPPGESERALVGEQPRPGDWEALVDRLLASPHFGERLAMWWLDAARYADTDGYQADETRTNWPWRDWVIGAFNANLPFDQFTLEQFAGDLLPDATPEQRLATCFHRNHMTNGEGGRDPEESRVDYVIDRVNTVGTVWMGLTLGCAQCHSHKFDPISQADYYGLAAFFDSIDEDGKAGRGAKPYLTYTSPLAGRALEEARQWMDSRRPALDQTKRDAVQPFERWVEARRREVSGTFRSWRPLVPVEVESVEGTRFEIDADAVVLATGPNPRQDDYRLRALPKLSRVTGLRLEVLPDPRRAAGSYARGESGEFILTDIKVQVRRLAGGTVRDLAVASAVADFSAEQKGDRAYGDIKGVLDDDPRNGWSTKGGPSNVVHSAVFALAEPYVPSAGEEIVFELRHRSTVGDANIGRFRVLATDERGDAVRVVGSTALEELAATPGGTAGVDARLRERLLEEFLADHPPYLEARAAFERAQAQFEEARKATNALDVMVLAERKEARETHVLVRGVWDRKGDKVARGAPPALAPWPAGVERSRVGLARWLVAPENPLTTRVVVNQLWQLCFGDGLVRTPEDLGVQGERPVYPELLDWLAVEFRESGWNVKHLLRLIVTSATYRQASEADAAVLAKDPQNRWLARGARFRLPSWMIRDAALVYAGRLNPAVGGPPVRPYQPDGLWEENFMGRFRYDASEGPAQHRRTLYAFWRRTIAPAFLFDTAQRRVCEIRTPRTNTPLQALALLNDETFLEVAAELADTWLDASTDPVARLGGVFRAVLGREPVPAELATLRREYERAVRGFETNPKDAARFLEASRPAWNRGPGTRVPERAAMAVVAGLILNLDETITHE